MDCEDLLKASDATRATEITESGMQVVENTIVSNDLHRHALSRNNKAGDGEPT